MAKHLVLLSYQALIITMLFAFLITLVSAEEPVFGETMSKKAFGLKREKLSHFHFYFHDTQSGNKPSAVQVLKPLNTTTLFGVVTVIDNPLTLGHDITTTMVGKAQGFYVGAAQQETSFLLAMNLVFTDKKYKGSSITILGSDPIVETVREMPVIGGSGIFRFARGYALARTYTVNVTSGDAVVEYDVYVIHYS